MLKSVFIKFIWPPITLVDSSGPWTVFGKWYNTFSEDTSARPFVVSCSGNCWTGWRTGSWWGTRAGRRTSETASSVMRFPKPCGLPATADQNSSGTEVTLYQLVEKSWGYPRKERVMWQFLMSSRKLLLLCVV